MRQRLLSHFSPALRSYPRVLGQGYGNLSTAAGYATSSESGSEGGSWFQKLKGVFTGKPSSEPQPQAATPDAKATGPKDFTMLSKPIHSQTPETFADKIPVCNVDTRNLKVAYNTDSV